MNIFIAISGMIGVGKTTLATELGKIMKLPIYYEDVIDNIYLTDFYKDPKKYGFPLQIYLLNKRFKQQQQIIWQDKGGIQDRSIYEDSIFCKKLMLDGSISKRDYDTYMELFANMSNFMKRPNLIVHLDITPEESLRRIKLRNRSCESSIPLSYLYGLKECYDEYLEKISKEIPVIKVNYSKFKTAQEMSKIIMEQWKKISIVRSIL